MNEWIDKEYWEDEFDVDEEDFYLNDYEFYDEINEYIDGYGDKEPEDDYEDGGGSLVSNHPKPKNPLRGAEAEPEKELVLA